MTQAEIDKLWAKRPQLNPKKATAYGLIKVREFVQRATALVESVRSKS